MVFGVDTSRLKSSSGGPSHTGPHWGGSSAALYLSRALGKVWR